jgi:hypothetical protein
MKKLFAFSSLLTLILSVNSAHTGDIQEGFMGIKWGAAVSTAGNLQEVRRTANIVYYIRPDEFYNLKNMKLGQPIYGFFQNKFFAVFIKLDSGNRIDEIKGFLDAEYGPARAQLRLAQRIYIYDYHHIKVKLKHYETEDTYKLGFYYTPLSTRLNESQLEKNFEIILPLIPSPPND